MSEYRFSKDPAITNWYNRTGDNANQLAQNGGWGKVSDLAPEVATAAPPATPVPTAPGSVTTPTPGAIRGPYSTLTPEAVAAQRKTTANPVGAAVGWLWRNTMEAMEVVARQYQTYINDPLTAGSLILAAPYARQKDESLGEYIKHAWNVRDELSFGQAEVAGDQYFEENGFKDPIHNITAFKEYLNPVTVDPTTGEQSRKVNWRSGSYDFVTTIGTDPLTYAGAPVKAVQAGARGAKIVDDITKAQRSWMTTRGVISNTQTIKLLNEGKFDPVLRRFTEITDPKVAAEYARTLRLEADDPDTFAFLASQIDRVEGMKDLFTLALRPNTAEGAAAGARLRTTHGADLAYYATKYAGHDPLFADQLNAAGDLLLSPQTQELMKTVVEKSDFANQAALDNAMAFSQGVRKFSTEAPGGALGRAPVKGRIREKRAFRGAARRTAGISNDPVVSTYKPHRYHPTVWYIEKPAGLVEPGSPDAFGEISASMKQLDRLTNGEFTAKRFADDGTELPSRAEEFTDRWFRASTLENPETARSVVASGLNDYALNKLLKMHHRELDDAQIQVIVDAASKKSSMVRQEINDKGWVSALDDNGGLGVVRYPALQRATPNAVPMYDFRALDRQIQKFETPGIRSVALNAMEGGTTGLDALMGVWKINVLLRLGYTMRNLEEASLSMAASGNLGNIISQVGPERLHKWGESAARATGRQVDHVGVVGGLLDQPQALGDQISAWSGMLAATNASADQMLEMLSLTQIRRLAKSSDPTEQMMAQQLLEARQALTAREVTYHATPDENWVSDKGRALSTSKSRARAEANLPEVPGPHVPGQPVPDTRGQQVFYHGTSQRILGGLEADTYSTMNIFGQGLYTTDDLTTAVSYTKKGKGKDPGVHKIAPKEDVKFYDLEGPVGKEIEDWLESIEGSSDTAADLLVDLQAGHFTNPRQVINEFRARSSGYMESADTVQEWFQSLREMLEARGYGGFSHLGGVTAKSGGRRHNVRVWWNPKEQLGLEDVDIAAYAAKPGPPVKVGKVFQVPSHGQTLDLIGGPVPSGINPGLVAAAKTGDRKSQQRLSDAAWAQGYGRVVLPDAPQWGGRQTIVNQRAVGPKGAQQSVQNRLKALVDEADESITDAPKIAGEKGRRQQRRESKLARIRNEPVPLSINPDYERDLHTAMMQGGLKEYVESLALRRAALDDQIDFLSARLTKAQERVRWTAPPKTIGRGFQQGTRGVISPAGEHYGNQAGAFGTHGGGLWEGTISSDSSYSTVTGDSYRGLMAGGAMLNKEVAPTNPRYYEAWAGILNLHFRDHQSGIVDDVVARILDGEEFDDILDWAIQTPEGYQWAKGIGITKTDDLTRPELTQANLAESGTIEETVASLMSAVNLYLPEGTIRDAFRTGAEIDEQALRLATAGQQLQPIRALLIPTSREAWAARTAAQKWMSAPAKAMKVLGSIPETSFARHPLFAAEFHRERRTLLGLAEEQKRARVAAETGQEVGTDAGRLTVAEFNKIDLQAHRRAQRTVEKTLFTTSRRSTVGGNAAIRSMYPFVSAYENVMQRWTQFVRADPSIPIRYANYAQKFNQGVVIVDADGNEIKSAADWTKDSMLVLPGLRDLHLPGRAGRAAELLAEKTRVPLKSMDVAFQGQPFNPGLGPLAMFPIVELVRRMPSSEQMFKWAMPYGVPETNWDLFLSSAEKRGLALWSDSSQVTNAFSKATLIAQYRHEAYGEPMPSLSELEKTTQSMFLLRLTVALGAPFATSFTNDRDFYAAKLREYQEVAIAEAKSQGQDESVGYDLGEANFYLDFPDAGLLVESLSKNPTRMRATPGVVANAQKYKDEIATAVGDLDPEVAGFIANYGVSGEEFSQAAYQWERSHGPIGSTQPYRQVGEPGVQVTEGHIREGWRVYRSYIDRTAAELQAKGIAPDTDLYQDVMTEMKKVAVAANAGNQDWSYAFKNPDTSKYQRRADAFKALLNDTSFSRDHEQDTLIQSMRLFFAKRDEMEGVLGMLKAADKPGSLDADANEPLRKLYEAEVQRLKDQSPEFTAWHGTFFITDVPKAA